MISGTPTSSGTFNFTVKVTDSENPPQSATKALSITITRRLRPGGGREHLIRYHQHTLARLGYQVTLAAPGDGNPPPGPDTPPGTTQGQAA